MYGVRDEVTAWCFDRAVWYFGTEVEAELREAGEGAKNKGQAMQRQSRVLAKWGLGEVRYRDPAAGAAKKDKGPVEETVSSTATGTVAL